MLSILLILILIWYFYIGCSRRVILQTYYFIAGIILLIVANQFYQISAEKITLWVPYSNASRGTTANFFTDVNIFDLDQVYCTGAAFAIVCMVVYLLFHFIGILAYLTPINRFDNIKTSCVSGVLTILAILIFLNPVFAVLATIPTMMVQSTLSDSFLVYVAVNGLSLSSDTIKALWITAILG